MSTIAQPTSLILAADCDQDDLTLLRLLLRKAGVEHPLELHLEGQSLMDALAKWASESIAAVRPLLCFLEINLQQLTGFEVLEWIRDQRSLDQVPVVVLSESTHPEHVRRAVKHGAQCYLAKYPQPEILREVVDEAHRFTLGAPADECFRLPANQLLVRARRLR